MATRTGFYGGADLQDPEGKKYRLLETLGEALALADSIEVDLVAIHIMNAIHAFGVHASTGTVPNSKTNVVAEAPALYLRKPH